MKSTTPDVRIVPLSAKLRADVLFVPLASDKKAARHSKLPAPFAASFETLHRELAATKQNGAIDDLILARGSAVRRIAAVSLWNKKKVTLSDARSAGAQVFSWCAKLKFKQIAVAVDDLETIAGPGATAAFLEGMLLAGFKFDRYRGKPTDEPAASPQSVQLATNSSAAKLRDIAERTRFLCECVNLARALGHEPPNHVNPITLARTAATIARQSRLKCRVIDDRQMKKLGMGAILAAGGGSIFKPRIIILEHRGGRTGSKPIVLIGKTVTLDTGGYSIKPAASIPEMKYDKCGGMAVIGTLVAAAKLKLPLNVVGILGAAENMISGEAYRPGDILRASNGKTIEVLDTDAEGRLVLSDCLHYAEKTFKPAAMIDLATLTGACTVALGDACAAIFANNDKLANALIDAGERTDERLWRLPLWPVYREQIAGVDSDLKNVGGRGAGAITAAMFLKEFVGDQTPWAHLDIAGVANTSKASAMCPAGATGFGVRLLIDFLQRVTRTSFSGTGSSR